METLVKTAEIVQAGTLMPNFMSSPGTNLPVLYRKEAIVSPPAISARLSEFAKGISRIKPIESPQNSGSKVTESVSKPKPKTYQRPSKGFD